MRIALPVAVLILAAVVVTFVHDTPVRMIGGLVAVIAGLYVGTSAGRVDRASVSDTDE